jgi:MFS family permease
LPAIFIPETLADAKAKMKTHQDEAPLASSEGMEPPSKQPMLQEIIHQAREFKKSTRFIWRDGNICLLVIITGVGFMSRQSTGLLMQYASKKFNWSIGKVRTALLHLMRWQGVSVLLTWRNQASLLISLRGIFSLSNYLVLMPAFNSIAGKFLNLHGKYRDYRLTQVTSVFTAVGFGIMAFAPVPGILIWGLVFLSIGLGFLVATRSLVTALVLPNHIGTLYSALAISQALGGLIAGPLFAYLFRLGMHLGNAWMGLPWLQASVIFILVSIVSWYIRVRDPVSHDEEEPLLAE